MKSGLLLVSITFLLSMGMESANAGPFGRIRGGREQARAEHQQHAAIQEEHAPVQGVQHGGPPPGFAAPPVGSPAAMPQNQVRRFGPRMSVEERQRLRRQINEAGQDIYVPRK